MGRGQLNNKAKQIAKTFLNRDISIAELRLYPYLDYQMKNEQKLNPARMNSDDRKVLSQLRKEGHIEGGASGLAMTREFYDYLQDILFETYVNY